MNATPQWKCAVCGLHVDVSMPMSWKCPSARPDDRHHVLMLDQPMMPLRGTGDDNPFVAFRRYLAWDAFAASLGLDDDARVALIRDVDAQVAAVAGTGFRVTPFGRHDALSDALGFVAAGGVWVKDETHNVAGSHKARHLFSELLHLVALETTGSAPWGSARPPLAIASCGNAAFAASTLAKAVSWPIRVFVPADVDAALEDMLLGVGATIERCERRASDPAGAPCRERPSCR